MCIWGRVWGGGRGEGIEDIKENEREYRWIKVLFKLKITFCPCV